MRALYLEPFSGLSGDMLNGLLLDLGGNLDLLKEELSKFTLEDYTIQVERTNKSSIFGMDFDVQIAHQHKDTGIKAILTTTTTMNIHTMVITTIIMKVVD